MAKIQRFKDLEIWQWEHCIRFEHDGNKEFNNFLTISKGSIGETRSQLYWALDFNYIKKEEFEVSYEKCQKLSRHLQKFSDYLRSSTIKGRKFNNL